MANFKTLNRILPYTPQNVPTLGAKDLPLAQFLNDEFKRVADPLRVLANDWVPNFELSMRGASLPTNLDANVATVSSYSAFIATPEVYATNVGVDLATGLVTFNSDAAVQYLVKIDASVVMERLSGSNNTTVFLYIVIDGFPTLVGTSFASNQTEYMTVLGSIIKQINGNAVVNIGLSYDGTAVVKLDASFINVNVLSLITT